MSNLLAPLSNRTFERLNQMMEDMWGQEIIGRVASPTTWAPTVDIHETDKQYTLTMDLPGFEQKDIDVEVCGDTLTIGGKREHVHDEKKEGRLIRYERKYGSFSRSFILNSAVKPSEVKANFRNGVLTLVVPKIEALGSTKIPVRE